MLHFPVRQPKHQTLRAGDGVAAPAAWPWCSRKGGSHGWSQASAELSMAELVELVMELSGRSTLEHLSQDKESVP